MREGPKPPERKDPADVEAEATLGHRIEQWDILADTSLSIQERKERLIKQLQKEADVFDKRQLELGEEHDELESIYDLTIEELEEDIGDILNTEDTEEALGQLIKDKKEYYAEAKAAYRRNA